MHHLTSDISRFIFTASFRTIYGTCHSIWIKLDLKGFLNFEVWFETFSVSQELKKKNLLNILFGILENNLYI